jgi:hypothetical protein
MESSKFKLNLSGIAVDSGNEAPSRERDTQSHINPGPAPKASADRYFKFSIEKPLSNTVSQNAHLLPLFDSSSKENSINGSFDISGDCDKEDLYSIDNRDFYKSFDFGKRRVMSKLEDSLEMKGLADSVTNFLKQSNEI